ncbi:MAG: sortase B protein-sorting domain-containing protein, partial [Bacilli bacterium]|nr:sortase B protein-sorting domain-containing protein [Bacilli bacterium]
AANGSFVKPGILIERDGKTYFQAQVTSWNMIESLTYNGKNVKIVSENKKQNSAVIEMEITGDLSDEILLGMSLYYGSQPVSHNARLILYPDSKKLIENDDDVDFGSGGKGGQTPLIPSGGSGTKGQPSAAEKSDKIQADRVFKFNYVIYKADANEPSAADQFFVKPGYLLEKNGKQYIQLYINGWNFMNWLKLKETNKHVDVVKVEGNRALIQFEYNGDLSKEIWLVMNLTVPGVYDKETYEARMVIDQASIEEIDPEGHYIHLAKPDFGDPEKDEKAGAKNTTNNPKTGDTSQVLFYTVLLIASLIALVYQVRKQLATSA